jgi:3-dehydroquinate synthetase
MKADKKVSAGKLNLILINKNFNAFKTSNFNNKNIIKALS